jgi:hypothetical protein
VAATGKSGIYYIENPKGKIYIGSTNNFARRKRQYRNGSCKDQIKIYRSIMKYGWDNHNFVEFVYCGEDQLLDREQRLLDFFKPELNINTCASKPPSSKGKKLTKEHVMKQAKSQGKPVLQFDLDGNLINQFWSAAEASRQTGIPYQSISRVCLGHKNKTHGFVWRFAP